MISRNNAGKRSLNGSKYVTLYVSLKICKMVLRYNWNVTLMFGKTHSVVWAVQGDEKIRFLAVKNQR